MDAPALSESARGRQGCELCGSTQARELYTARDRLSNADARFAIAECLGCGVLRTLPEMTDAQLAAFYPNDYWGGNTPVSEDWIRKSQHEKIRVLFACGLKGGRILDVGCGAGFFLRALDSERWDAFGVEVGAAASAAAKLALGKERVFNGSLVDAACAESFFDVVTLWSTLEHTNEPRLTLEESRRILKPGGSIIVQVPNASSYQARLFGGAWFSLDAPRHRYHFTKNTLLALLHKTGFDTYYTTFFSRTHNSHALKQSLKFKLAGGSLGVAGKAMFHLAAPFIKPFDWLLTVLNEGATLTVAARVV
jgi:2-polyprenyl-3-methyl-5-hydroxy-6-metoxy-1,4-benzoquinol methylase